MQGPTRRLPLHGRLWAGGLGLAASCTVISVLPAVGTLECGGWGFGCDPAFVAIMAVYLLGPPVVAAAVVVDVVARLIGPRAAPWTAACWPPVIAVVLWAWEGIL